jgi:hypothetical protein
VRTGKHYGKTSLTAHHGRDLARASAQVPLAPRRAGFGWSADRRGARGTDHPQGL